MKNQDPKLGMMWDLLNSRGQKKAQEEVLHECEHARWILLQQQRGEEEEEGEG